MRTVLKPFAFWACAIAVVWAIFAVFGIHVQTTSESFAERAGMPLFEAQGNALNVRLHPTPAKWPSEARTIYWAARLNIPVEVSVPDGNGRFAFKVSGLSKEHDFIVPCESKLNCARVLRSAGSSLPTELSSSS